MELDVATARAGTVQRVVRVGFGRIFDITTLGQPDFEYVIDTRFAHVIYHNAELNVAKHVARGRATDTTGRGIGWAVWAAPGPAVCRDAGKVHVQRWCVAMVDVLQVPPGEFVLATARYAEVRIVA